jgi:myo-inositol-1(or 4)-monophosphatase
MKHCLNVKDLSLDELKLSLTEMIAKAFEKKDFLKSLDAAEKKDGTLVTQVDLMVHDFIESKLRELEVDTVLNFVSEESDLNHDVSSFPALVLDPIDGTKELTSGLSECCVSLAYLAGPDIKKDAGWGWLYNPLSGFQLSSDQPVSAGPALNKQVLLGLVSRTEFEKGIFANERPCHDVVIVPKGSIAFKLGLLASGACDFVVSRRPKNLWDIAAGTLLCRDRGHHFYTEHGEAKSWKDLEGSQFLLWCRPAIHHRVYPLFQI